MRIDLVLCIDDGITLYLIFVFDGLVVICKEAVRNTQTNSSSIQIYLIVCSAKYYVYVENVSRQKRMPDKIRFIISIYILFYG